MTQSHHIAVVGMAGRFPGAADLGQFWANLRDGVECVEFPTDEQLRASGVPEAMLADPHYVKARATAPHVQDLDAALFGYTPREAANSDPQIRMFLECAHAALEHSGYNPYDADRTISVYGSAGTNRYVDLHLGNAGDSSATSSFSLSSLNNTDHVASTTAYKLNLRGAAITVATACSSSLVAVHLAGQALRNGECDIAVAGGSELELPFGHGYLWAEGSPFSRDGHVRPFDVKADGTLFSSGAGAVVLKRLADALADGDTIHAVVRGSAVNNDGSAKAGFTAPSVHGQAMMLAEAFAMAEVTAEELSFVECHATGTLIGDPIEVTALHRALRMLGGQPSHPIALGSVKSAVGHLGHAAGIASFIKAVLTLSHGQMPATVNFTEPNPKLDLDATPFVIADRLRPLAGTRGIPHIGGVSSFGVGGTNAHAVLQAPPARHPAPGPRREQVVVWSAQSETANREYRHRLRDYFADSEHAPAFDAAVHTLQHGRRAYQWRSAVVTSTADGAAAALSDVTAVIDGANSRREVVFAFPGQGSQKTGMATRLYREDPRFARFMDEVLDLFATQGVDVKRDWLDGEDVTGTVAAQALLFAVEHSLARSLLAHGVTPAALIGHSVGELAAAAVASVFSLPDAVVLVAARARAMAAAAPGAMLAVAMPVDELAAQLPEGLTLAVVNGSRQCVLSGGREAVAAAHALFRERKVASTPLDTAGAFHSPLMLPAAQVFAAAFDGVRLAEPRIPVYSAAAGARIGAEQAMDPGFWADQVAGPVRFDRAVAALLADGTRLVLEVGPDRVLSSLGRQADGDHGSAFVPVLPDGDAPSVLRAVAQVWVEGHDVAWPEADEASVVRRVPLPGYPYQRKRHWVEPVAARVAGPVPSTGGVAVRPEPADEGTPLSVVAWTESPAPPISTLDGHCLVLAPEGEASLPLVLALQQAGAIPVPVRPGQRYEEAAGEFRVRPSERADLERVLDTMARRGTPAAFAVHALTLTGEPEPLSEASLDASVERTFASLLALAQAASGRAGLLVVSRGAVDVTGAEPVDPAAAMLVGFARSLALEEPGMGCRVVDVAAAGEGDLAAEVGLWQRHDVVALRGSRRWTASLQPLRPDGTAMPVRRQGVYVITGGTGGLGMAMARGLAGTGMRPRLVLLGRTGLADGEAGERADRLRAQLAELTSLGAQVRVMACDVADRRALRRVLDTVAAQFGAVNGVLHLAGVPGDGLVRLRDPGRAAEVLAPKVRGTLLLAEALRDRPPLDFFVCFSSRAATDGLVGSADYAAANAFQDAMATVLRRGGVPALSINWPSWSKVGMAAEYGMRVWTVEMGPHNSPFMDEHRLRGVAVLPGTGQLDLMLRGHRELTGRGLPIRLTDVVYHQVMSGEEPRRVEIRLHPDGVLESWSRPVADPAAEPVRHASARVAAASAPAGQVDLTALRERVSEPVNDAASDEPKLFRLGRRWDNITATWCLPGDDAAEMLLALELPEEFDGDLDRHAIHPSLLDSAVTLYNTSTGEFHLPFGCESIEFYDSLPARFFAHGRRRPSGSGIIRADLDLLAPDGRLLGRAVGYMMRRVEPGGVAMSGDGGSTVDDGIDPKAGVKLTLSLLASRHPGQVLVEPGARPVAAAPVRTPVQPPPPAPVAAPAPALPSPRRAPEGRTVAAAPVADDLAARVKALWVEAIGDPELSENSDFFEVGGNSLTAVALIGSIRESFGVDISIGAIFDYPTIGALAALLREQGAR